MRFFHTSTGEKIQVDSKPLAKGGAEGSVFAVLSPVKYKDSCVKIYNPKIRMQINREAKIAYMVQNPPQSLSHGKCQLCWPTELIYEDIKKKIFLGFIMRKAFKDSISLYELCTMKFDQQLPQIWQAKYDRKRLPDGLIARLKLCVNIAGGIFAIHQTKHYVLVDFKPQNVLITSDGQVSIIDLDSIQIQANGQVFHAKYSTPEYAPKEGKGIDISKSVISETWDRFSLGVVFYQLIFGLHPFTVTPKDPPGGNTLTEHINNGLFPFGINKQKIANMPSQHDLFWKLPETFKQLFIRCFDTGTQTPGLRPSAKEWGEMMYNNLEKAGANKPVPVSTIPHPVPLPSKPIPSPAPIPKRAATPQKNWFQRFLDWLFGS